jgi:hypothetical protein
MAKIWVLDTETKGTGAEMVPLERALERKRSAPKGDRIKVVRRRPEAQPPEAADEAASVGPREFKLVNALSGQVLAERAGTREVVDLIGSMRSLADARIYVWEPADDAWRPLTLREQKAIWDLRAA